MQVSKAIELLQAIQKLYGDIKITGGSMHDDVPLNSISVTDDRGMEVWPKDPNGVAGVNAIDGVFLQ